MKTIAPKNDTTGIPAATIITEADGTFTAVTFTASKNFKTRKGAEGFMTRRGF